MRKTRNVTLRLDEGVLRDARHIAVENDQSLSRWVANLITQTVRRSGSYNLAKKRALRRMSKGLPLGGHTLSKESLRE